MGEIKVLKKSKKEILLGNEAIVRGAIEAGVEFVSTYPGTPASEIGNLFSLIAQKNKLKFYFEFSTNEKVALEAVIGASFSGLKSLVAMKHFGLNVASDALMPFLYTGSKGPTVIVVADDPSCHSSAQSEESSRAYSYLAHIPTLEPSDPQECKDFVLFAFELSERFQIPVLIRLTTRVSHQSAPVKFADIKKIRPKKGFVKDYPRFVTMPPRVLEQKKELLAKIKKIKEVSQKSKINKTILGRSKSSSKEKIGVITSGVSYLYVREALKELNLSLPILKLGFFYPLPDKKIKKFITPLKKILVVEELEPYLEKEVKILTKEANPKLKIFGKDLISQIGELKPEDVIFALSKMLNLKWRGRQSKLPSFPKRLPSLCSGCPYWLVFSGVKTALRESGLTKKDIVFGGDIGCYMMASLPPHNLCDYLLCMGSSLGIAHGIKKANRRQKVIAFIGDSTFFHAGLPALINIIHNQSNPLIIIMDNQTTAMTGLQPHPGLRKTGRKLKGERISLENLIKGLGVKNLSTIDPKKDFFGFVKKVKEYLKRKEVSIIIAKHPCIYVAKTQRTI
jgi:indolepyruvate ferredoxin oxidoreductase alpha subunit